MSERVRICVALTAFGLCMLFDLWAFSEAMIGWKEFLGYCSVSIAISAYIAYIAAMFPRRRDTAIRPEPVSWFLFGFLTAGGWVVQLGQGAAAGSWCLGVTAIFCWIIAVISLLRFSWPFDRWHAATAASAGGLFLFSILVRNNPVFATASALAATSADMISYTPTFRKAWSHPDQDDPANFLLNAVKCIPALFALDNFNVATSCYLIMLLLVNSSFSLFLWVWRKQSVHYKAPLEIYAAPFIASARRTAKVILQWRAAR